MYIHADLSGQSIGIGTETPNPKAALDVSSSSKGLLIPRMTTLQRNNMNPGATEEGMMVYDLNLEKFMSYNGTSWEEMGSNNIWDENATDVFYTGGDVGIGKTNPSYPFDIYGSKTRALNISNVYDGTGTKYGIFNSVSNAGTGTRYGLYNIVYTNQGTSSSYGQYNYTAGSATSGAVYGVFSYVTAGSGHADSRYALYGSAFGADAYGVYGNNSSSAGYAGYFNGRGMFTNNLFVGSMIEMDAIGYQSGGEIIVRGQNDSEGVRIRGNEGANNGAAITLYNKAGNVTVELDGEYGDGGPGRVITDELQIKGGSDLSENFDIIENNAIAKPGMLVSIDPNSSGKLVLTNESYDHKVAGIISGANGVNPGMLMGQSGSIADGEFPIALSGRVYVYANTESGAIKPGDLLTSSTQIGYAMKADDSVQAQGAVIGKAMTELKEGSGFVLVLVNLQ
ncbi:MAG: hypothetical protein AAGK97_03130 [Bacteroidota bacterium]